MSSITAEKNALVVGAIINVLMAISGWLAYYFSNSQAILLDGNFSFIAFLVTLIAIRISTIKAKTTDTFPFGQYVYEALFSFSKGIMIIGVLLMALVMSISRISHYLNGAQTEALNTSIILIYTVAMVILCLILALYCRHQNKKLNNSSTILRAEYLGAKVDGFMSLAAGLALFGIGYVNIESDFGFLHYIGDAILVILLVLLLGKGPFVLVRDSFVEMAGGVLQNKDEKEKIESILVECFPIDLLKESYISKTGSSYLVVAYMNGQGVDHIGYEALEQIKIQALEKLKLSYQHAILEVVLA